MPKTSVIITTHNRPFLLPRAVDSARAAGSDVEVVVVDDASTDETAQVCQSLAGINYVRAERNQGVAGARNIGLVASRGQYIAFLDDDDARLPDSLDRQVAALEKEPDTGLIYGQAIIDESDDKSQHRSYPNECPQGDIFWNLLSRNFIPCGSVLFRRACLSRIGLLDDNIPGLDDWDLWVRIAEIYRIIAVAIPVITWRRSTPASGQGTSQSARLVALGVRQFRQRWINLPRAVDAPLRTKRAAWRRFSENMAEHLIWESVRAFRCRQIDQGLKNISILPRLHWLALMRIAKNRLLDFPWPGLRDTWHGSVNSNTVGNRANSKF